MAVAIFSLWSLGWWWGEDNNGSWKLNWKLNWKLTWGLSWSLRLSCWRHNINKFYHATIVILTPAVHAPQELQVKPRL